MKKEYSFKETQDENLQQTMAKISEKLLETFIIMKEFNKKITRKPNDLSIEDIIQKWKKLTENDRIKFILKEYQRSDEIFLNNEELKEVIGGMKNYVD